MEEKEERLVLIGVDLNASKGDQVGEVWDEEKDVFICIYSH